MWAGVVSKKWMVTVKAESWWSPWGWAGCSILYPCAPPAPSITEPGTRVYTVPGGLHWRAGRERTALLSCFKLVGLPWGKLEPSYSSGGRRHAGYTRQPVLRVLDPSLSACVGNPSSWGILWPGLCGWSGSALLVWGAPKGSYTLGGPPEAPRLELLHLLQQEKLRLSLTWGSPGSLQAKGTCGCFSHPSAWKQTQPVSKHSLIKLSLNPSHPWNQLMPMDCRGDRGGRLWWDPWWCASGAVGV